jgi:hypothetical protein
MVLGISMCPGRNSVDGTETCLRVERSGVRNIVGENLLFSTSVSTSPGTHSVPCTMGTGCISRVERGRSYSYLLGERLKMDRIILLFFLYICVAIYDVTFALNCTTSNCTV